MCWGRPAASNSALVAVGVKRALVSVKCHVNNQVMSECCCTTGNDIAENNTLNIIVVVHVS